MTEIMMLICGDVKVAATGRTRRTRTMAPATNNNNNEKLILIQDGDYEVSKRLWSFAHCSRFIRPDAYRVGVNDNDLHSSAYLNEDGSYVAVVLNPTYKEHSVSVDFGKWTVVSTRALLLVVLVPL